MEIFCLKVHRKNAGKTFPFDRVYLIKHADRAELKKLFNFALVMPVEGHLKAMLLALTVDEFVNHEFERNDEEKEAVKPADNDWVEMLDDGPWIMLVPILGKWANQTLPRYILAEGWYRPIRKSRKSKETYTKAEPFPTLTYLQTPTRNIRPVCMMCPRFIEHQNGGCKLGDKVCFTELPLGIENLFKQSLEAPGPTPNVKEPEEAEFIHADVP